VRMVILQSLIVSFKGFDNSQDTFSGDIESIDCIGCSFSDSSASKYWTGFAHGFLDSGKRHRSLRTIICTVGYGRSSKTTTP
jgi:hypothetical protein